MEKEYIAHPRVIWLWWLQTLLIVLFVCLAATIFFPLFSERWIWVILGSLVIFSILSLVYFRFRWENYYFYIENAQLVIHGGVLFTWEDRTTIGHIQFITRKISIFERLLKLSTLQLSLLGGRIKLYGLDYPTVASLEQELEKRISKFYGGDTP